MLLLLVQLAQARDVSTEISKYGMFKVTKPTEASCKISLISPTHGTVELQAIEDCTSVDANERLGTALFPMVAADGTEFHVFSIGSLATMGNACGSDQMDLILVLAPNQAWALYSSGYCRNLQQASLGIGPHGATLSLEQPANTTREGLLLDIWMGGSAEKQLPKMTRNVLSTQTQSYQTLLNSASHASNYMPYLEVNGETILLIEGSCKIDSFYESAVDITVRAEKLNDGSTETTCTAIKAHQH